MVSNYSGQLLQIGAKHGTAAVSKNPKAALSTIPDDTFFYHTGKGINFRNFVLKFRF